ncbi:MAG: hypothetical protein U9N53_15310 [Bacteroidota bacterium]|nr:hypothetical protein [Bacteroidota bacterium]
MQERYQTWEQLLTGLNKIYDIPKNLMSVLFIIGLQEVGSGFKKYSQAEKTEIIKTAQIKLLSREKYYLNISADNTNLPIWAENPEKQLPAGKELEKLLQSLSLNHFNEY